MRKIVFGIIAIILMVTGNLQAAAISCDSSDKCTVGLLKSGSFDQYMDHSISLAGIAADDQQTFSYDNTTFTVTCDGSWKTFATPAYPVPQQNQIACTIINEYAVSVQLRIYYDSIQPPDSPIVTRLSSYTENHPYQIQTDINQNNVQATAIASEWETRTYTTQATEIGYDITFYAGYDSDGGSKDCFWAKSDKTCQDDWSKNVGWPTGCTNENLAHLGDIIQAIVFPDGHCASYTDPISGVRKCFSRPANIPIATYQFLSRTDSGKTPGCYGSGDDHSHQLWHIRAFTVSDPDNYQLQADGSLLFGLKETPDDVPVFSKTIVNNLLLIPQLTLESSDTPTGVTDKQDDGQVNGAGECLGTLYLFSGKDKRCRDAGIQDMYTNCCNHADSSISSDTMYLSPLFWAQISLLFQNQCTASENQLLNLKNKGVCHYVGRYCAASIPLIGCVQHKKTYCCFNSMLGRILQEQGRPTLKAFGPGGGWGNPKSPNCRGFTPEEFQLLDFSKIDMSEWYGNIQTQTQDHITGTIQNNLNQLYGQ